MLIDAKQYSNKVLVKHFMRTLLFCILICAPFLLLAQKEKPKNYRLYDEHPLHFGFMLGINQNDFTVYQHVDAYSKYGLKSLTSKKTPGGQVGIVSTLSLGTPVVRLRFIPTLSFQERVLNYTFENREEEGAKDIILEERVGSTNIDLPLMLQFRTLRYNNFAAYVLGGVQYTIDLQSQEKANQSTVDPFIKLKKKDYQLQLGCGVEFFAEFFKFGMEVKYSYSMHNSLIQDFTPSSNPINSLYNKTMWFSIIFEG